MQEFKEIPIIDLFAGPGGLGEGFSSVKDETQFLFDIKLSIEKDSEAHKTLKLRSFYRKFIKQGKVVPAEYYNVLKETDLKKRGEKITILYENYKEEAIEAENEARNIELGSDKFPPEYVDALIEGALKESEHWVLIGGPPCQAYSVAGRVRVGGVHESDHRVYLYREYLRIIAKHHPSVFVMENVKGLLSASLNGEKIFDRILNDLEDPSSVFKESLSPKYKVYSLVKKEIKSSKDFLIKAENYSIPQKRHRVILLGIREDINVIPDTLKLHYEPVTLKSVIGLLPPLRSEINRVFTGSSLINGKKKRIYSNLEDSFILWKEVVLSFKEQITSVNDHSINKVVNNDQFPSTSVGAEFIECGETINQDHCLYSWYFDPLLNGVINHKSRSHLLQDLERYLFACIYTKAYNKFPRLADYEKFNNELLPDHENAKSGKFKDRFRVQLPDESATTITSHINKDGHYFIHYDHNQCRSLTVREAARIQTFPDNYLFCGSRTQQFQQVGNAVPPFLAKQIGEIVGDIFKKIALSKKSVDKTVSVCEIY